MIVGILKEIKPLENRVAMLPDGVEQLVACGHPFYLETKAGEESGFSDVEYEKAGAKVLKTAEEIYNLCELIIKVKEPLPEEYPLIRKGQIIFTYFHFAASEKLTRAVINSGCIAVAYETVEKEDGTLPLLTPMSEIAGRMAIQEGAKYLEKTYGGMGLLLGGVPGVDSGTVLIIGGGVVGTNAAKMACGLGGKVYLLDNNLDRLRYLSDIMPRNCYPIFSSPSTIRKYLPEADLVIGAVLIPGAVAPKLINRDMLKLMKKGSVLVDVAIDQGGCFETSKPTTHDDPIFNVDGVIHYCVSNMPGAVSRTSTIALTNATLPYVVEIANKGIQRAIIGNSEIEKGVNITEGKVTCPGVAETFSLECHSYQNMINRTKKKRRK
ncbi:MAG: alanine dehydrogenase [Deltaproteobacteria bacterium]|nr:alanine dehydrogenase [Deltaproteobacteria bacterium]